MPDEEQSQGRDHDETGDGLTAPAHPVPLPYGVVGIDAPAAAREACFELLKNLSPDTGMAYVLLVRLSPDQQSDAVTILAQYTAMPVVEVESEQRPEPNRVYVTARNTQLTISEGVLKVEASFPLKHPSGDQIAQPVDSFFRSLASDQKHRAIGVLLNGMCPDGALGLRAIKAEGGFAFAQQRGTAGFPEVARKGLALEDVHFILPPDEIALELARLSAGFEAPDQQALEAGNLAEGAQREFARIFDLLRGVSGVEFRQYMPATLQCRVARRMMLERVDTLGEYARLLHRDPEELWRLQEDVLTNTTRFFRDADVWDTLKTSVLPEIFARRAGDRPVRVWVPGCSTGEEAYSVAICFLEHFGNEAFQPAIQIFGTDVSKRSIERARAGEYPVTLAREISAERLERFFVKTDRGFQVSKRVRDLCIFARRNLCSDPPFSKVDLVSCRNVLTYLRPQSQQEIIRTFHYALRLYGLLLIGSSEQIGNSSDLFTPLDAQHKFYVRNEGSSELSAARVKVPELRYSGGARDQAQQEARGDLELQRAAERLVSARYGPPGVVVNERLEILQSLGHTARYIEMQPVTASLQMLRNLRESIAPQVRDAVRRCMELDRPVHVERVEVWEPGGAHQVALQVFPIKSSNTRSRSYLVLFTKPAQRVGPSRREREERDLQNQELISANEEIQSANEELQSANQELQTTKEDLQSANEELQTVNDELRERNGVLSQTRNDLSNLVTSVSLPVLIVDRQLQIRHYTPPTERLMSIRSSDIGRPLSGVRMHLKVRALEPLLIEVLDTLVAKEMEVQDREGRWYLMRIRPYRTADNKIDGVLIALVDIDQLRRGQQDIREARDYAQRVIECVQVPIVVLTLELRIRTVNSAFCAMADLSMEKVQDRFFPDLVGSLWGMEHIRSLLQQLTQAPSMPGFVCEHQVPGPESRVLRIIARGVAADGHYLILVTLQDLTIAKHDSELLESERQRLSIEMQSTVAELGRTQSELRALAASLFTSQEEERRRVARELHDDISQQLALLAMELEHCYQRFPGNPGAVHERLDSLRNRAGNLAEGVRRISHGLHPAILDDLGLSHALKALTEEFGEREGMVATFSRREVPATLPREVAGALYRIAQEALRNVAKHAGPTHAKVTLERKEASLLLEIADLGEGFDPEESRGGLGLISMGERARLVHGTFSVRSALGKGTTVSIEVPLLQREGQPAAADPPEARSANA